MTIEPAPNLGPARAFSNPPQFVVNRDEVGMRIRHDEVAETVQEPLDNPITTPTSRTRCQSSGGSYGTFDNGFDETSSTYTTSPAPSLRLLSRPRQGYLEVREISCGATPRPVTLRDSRHQGVRDDMYPALDPVAHKCDELILEFP